MPESASTGRDPHAPHSQGAQEAFAAFLKRLSAGGDADFEAVVDDHPSIADELRDLHAKWMRLNDAMDRLMPPMAHDDGARHDGGNGRGTNANGSGSSSEAVVQRLTNRRDSYERYHVHGEMARGGMGAVLRVWDEDLRRHLAMKVILGRGTPAVRGDTPSVDSRSLGRFLEEAQVTGQLDHPGIVPVHELGVDSNGRAYFTMKLVKGETLKEILASVRAESDGWSVTRALGVVLKICEATAYAHHKGIVHRDLKPSNVMVGRFGEVYVMDWGLARVLDRSDHLDESQPFTSDRHESTNDDPDSPLRTQEGDILGTVPYMSPEQAAGQVGELGPATDIYAVGAILYHLFTGRLPYANGEKPTTNYAMLARVREGPPEPLLALAPDVPAELVAITEKAMARAPEARYASMTALGDDLRAFLEKRVVRAYQTGAVAEFRKWVVRNRGMAAALASLVVLALSAASLVAWLEADKNERLSTAYGVVQDERDEKQRLSDVMTAQVLLGEVTGHAPSEEGIRRMERWLARFEDVGGRRSSYESELVQSSLASTVVSRLEVRELLETLDRLQEIEPAVRERLQKSRELGARWMEQSRELWETVRRDVAADERFEGLELSPQRGLVPLRKGPESGLWEFWHVLSGSRPDLDERHGMWRIEPESGLVLVLLPGGEVQVGSPTDEFGHDRDELLHEVALEPFFLSKYETTQAQWARELGSNPSYYAVGTVKGGVEVSGVNPVEAMTFDACQVFALRQGLKLPSEEQWEHACRAGVPGPYHWGDLDEFEDRENMAEEAFLRLWGEEARERHRAAPWDDGFAIHAPVGSFAPNAFGLYDMHGNVAELTGDTYDRYYSLSDLPEDLDEEVVEASLLRHRVVRGSSFYWGPVLSRAAMRQPIPPGNAYLYTGVRMARELDR